MLVCKRTCALAEAVRVARPEQARELATAMCLLHPDVMEYKGMTHIKGAALGYLQNICAAAMAPAAAQ